MKTKFLSVLVLSFFVFVSCNNDDNETPINDGMVKFTSGIETKVGGSDGNQWEGNEAIGIYMIAKGDPGTILEQAENIQYTTQSVGSSAEFTSTTPIYYPVSGQKVSFIAYHPFNNVVDQYIYPVDLSDQSNQSALDLLVATANNGGAGYDKIYGDVSTNIVDLEFSHQLAKVVINVSAGEGVTSLTGLSVVIEGMNTTADFKISDPELINEDDMLNLTPYKQNSSYVYEAILLPVTLDNTHVVKFTVGGNTYSWTISDNTANINEFKTGEKYTFDVKLLKNTVRVAGTIEKWKTVTGGNGEAK